MVKPSYNYKLLIFALVVGVLLTIFFATRAWRVPVDREQQAEPTQTIVQSTRVRELRQMDVAVTAYNVNRAVVKDTREYELKMGENWIDFSDVAARIDPTSVHLTSPGIDIKEQNFDYDLVTDAKLLNKYLGEHIVITDKNENIYRGILIAGSKANINPEGRISYFLENPVIEDESGILHIIPKDNVADVSFPLLPGGLVTRPTLKWKVISKKEGVNNCEIAYITKGMSWKADYEIFGKKGWEKVDLSGMITLDNQTGASYENAKLKLVAGKVHVVEEEERYPKAPKMAAASPAEKEPQFKEKEFFEYHLYTLQRRTTLKDNQTKQIDFIDANDIEVKRIYVYDGALFMGYSREDLRSYGIECNKKVDIYLEFKNSEENNMGMPLPKGRVQIKERDKEGKERYLSEDEIDHTPKDEKVLVRTGADINLVGERKQTDFKRPTERVIEESFEIVLRNRKKEDVEIRVVEHLYRGYEWEIIEKSDPFQKTDHKTVEFRINVPSGNERKVFYKVRYM